MRAALLAIVAGLTFGVSSIFLKRALQYTTPLTATIMSVTFTTALVWVFAAATAPLGAITLPRVLPFLVAGLVAPGLARLALFHGVDRIGVARSSILVGVSPLFAIGMAILFLGERPGVALLFGAFCVVGGGWLLSARGTSEETGWRPRDMLLPLIAALGFAFRDNVSRWGFREFPEPLIAAAAATLSSVVIMWLFALTQRGTGRLRLRATGLGLLAVAGVAEGIAYVTMWHALAVGQVSVVSPLVHAQPVFSVALAAIFLRDLETVTWRLGVAAGLVVAGASLVIWARPG